MQRGACSRARASFSTEAQKVSGNSNKLTIELVNTDARDAQPDCKPLGKHLAIFPRRCARNRAARRTG